MAEYGGAVEGDRTMMDALLPAARALHDAADAGAEPGPCSTVSVLGSCRTWMVMVLTTAAARLHTDRRAAVGRERAQVRNPEQLELQLEAGRLRGSAGRAMPKLRFWPAQGIIITRKG